MLLLFAVLTAHSTTDRLSMILGNMWCKCATKNAGDREAVVVDGDEIKSNSRNIEFWKMGKRSRKTGWIKKLIKLGSNAWNTCDVIATCSATVRGNVRTLPSI